MLSSADAAVLFKALSDETRLRIVELVARGEKCACDLLEAFQLTQPTISYHMKILCDAGLVRARKDGAWMRYTLDTQTTEALDRYLAVATRADMLAHDDNSACGPCASARKGEV
ncbi:MAG: winged helix-turn-helix transcriptional regulator [Clostridiaceae bacterium]|jgi:ArsR family transcriptional regulator|nr:winged helix-turn-helix transcriptional regulator [Clostridiaceae bacterium]